MQIEAAYMTAPQRKRQDRAEDDEGDTGWNAHETSPLSGARGGTRGKTGWGHPCGAAPQTKAGQDDGLRSAFADAARMGAFSYFLKASLTFAPAILLSPLTWSPRPSAFRRELPVARPTAFLAPPFTASALCANFLKILTGDTFHGVIRGARTRQPGHFGPASRR